MKKHDQGMTRRDLLRSASAAAIIGATATACDEKPKRATSPADRTPAPSPPPAPAQPAAPVATASTPSKAAEAEARSRVVLIRDQQVLRKGRKVDAEVIARMLDDAVNELLGETDATAAWKRLVRPDDVVLVKSNQWRFLRTPPELEAVLRQRLESAGVAADAIEISDRTARTGPIFARSTALINARPMRTHHWSGVGSLIKNYINLHPEPASWHGDSCAELAGVWQMPQIKDKTRLNILLMLTPLFHGKGPHHYQSKYTWEYNGLIVGTDPVAVDATGLRILQAKRLAFFGKEQPFSTPVTHLRVAEQQYGLGIADPARIDVVAMGWDVDRLI